MSAPTAADWLSFARLMNGVCAKCGAINAHDGNPRCDCATAPVQDNSSSSAVQESLEQPAEKEPQDG